VSRQQLEQDQSQASVAEAEVNAQEAAIGAQSAQLGYYRISAPFDGAVGDIPVKVGDYVGPQTKLTRVDHMTQVGYLTGQGTSLDLVVSASALRQAQINRALRDFDLVRARIDALLALADCRW
jgi:multidrug efflux pump subunit AcrA (membrane-fusion protein)